MNTRYENKWGPIGTVARKTSDFTCVRLKRYYEPSLNKKGKYIYTIGVIAVEIKNKKTGQWGRVGVYDTEHKALLRLEREVEKMDIRAQKNGSLQ